MNLYLIGYRGVGKSSTARELADRTGWQVFSSDDWVTTEAGQTIRAIFQAGGESAFRDLEHRALLALTARKRAIVDLGGGAVLREDNRRLLKTTGCCVWLRAEPACLAQRITKDPRSRESRPPLINHQSPIELAAAEDDTCSQPVEAAEATRDSLTSIAAEVETVLAARYPIYAECADWVIDTDTLAPTEVAERIMAEMPCFR